MLRFIIWMVVLFGCLCSGLFAQIPNQDLSDKISVNEADSGRFGFTLWNTNYLRNTEYFNPVEEGRTLFGYLVQPKFFWQPGKGVKLELGVFARHDFGGRNGFRDVQPTFSLKATGRHSELIFGTLEGALSHGMLEPMMDINSAIERRIENGFQYRYKQTGFDGEVWINWENYIEKGDFDKERFTAGANLKANLLEEGANSKLFLYGQAMLHHQGGQIGTDTLQPFLMLRNGALGLRLEQTIGPVQTAVLDIAALDFDELGDSKLFPKKYGTGVLVNAILRWASTDWMVTYWAGQNFVALGGTALYQSISTVDPANYEKNRQLIFFRVIRNKSLFDGPVMASMRFEPVYDLNLGILDFSYSMYLVYRCDWRVGKQNK